MKVSDVINSLGLNIISGQLGIDKEVTGGYVSDLLSDVMGNSKEGQIWITLQTHKNVLAIASLKDLAAVIMVKGFQPDNDTIELSNEENVPVLVTSEATFDIAGKLFNLIK